MPNNPFIDILHAAGFSRGASGRFFDADSKYSDGICVEIDDTMATVCFDQTTTKSFFATPSGINDFRSTIMSPRTT